MTTSSMVFAANRVVRDSGSNVSVWLMTAGAEPCNASFRKKVGNHAELCESKLDPGIPHCLERHPFAGIHGLRRNDERHAAC